MSATTPQEERFPVLDGWRGTSILLVLAAHLLPLGPKPLQLNATAGPMGMALFFTLSGFLITHFLLARPDAVDFLIRRFARVVPLAWLYMAIALVLVGAPIEAYLPHFLFYANWPPMPLTTVTGHLWSVCVEVQFYVGVAILVALAGRRGLLAIPLICIAVTLLRVAHGVPIAINTYYRVDEILAGSMIALAAAGKLGTSLPRFLGWASIPMLLVLFVVSCHPESGAMNFLRPYLAAAVVGATLCRPDTLLARALRNRVLAYVALISYALYVIHPLLAHSWLGSGDTLVKYAKRPLLFAALFALAHLSTMHFEKRCIAFGKAIASRRRRTLSA